MGTDWLSRHEISLEELKHQIFRSIWSYGPSLSEEVFSELLLRLSRILRDNPEKFSSAGALYAYARKAAAREARRLWLRAKRQRPTDPTVFSEIVSQSPSSDNGPTKEDLLQLLSDPTQREVVRLHLEGIQGKVIAKVLGLNPSKVSQLLTKAKLDIGTRYANEWRSS